MNISAFEHVEMIFWRKINCLINKDMRERLKWTCLKLGE